MSLPWGPLQRCLKRMCTLLFWGGKFHKHPWTPLADSGSNYFTFLWFPSIPLACRQKAVLSPPSSVITDLFLLSVLSLGFIYSEAVVWCTHLRALSSGSTGHFLRRWSSWPSFTFSAMRSILFDSNMSHLCCVVVYCFLLWFLTFLWRRTNFLQRAELHSSCYPARAAFRTFHQQHILDITLDQFSITIFKEHCVVTLHW